MEGRGRGDEKFRREGRKDGGKYAVRGREEDMEESEGTGDQGG